MNGILIVLLVVGLIAAVAGTIGIIRDGRRIVVLVIGLGGLGTAIIATSLLLALQGHELMMLAVGLSGIVVLLAGNVLGYPLLTGFLLWSGITVLFKETRTLGNALALLAGMALLVFPLVQGTLAPGSPVEDNTEFIVRYALHGALLMIVAYIAFTFGAFLAASLMYRFRRSKVVPEAIIVLGAGLIAGEVGPLLAGRLNKGLEVQRNQAHAPMFIPSGGQGEDEPRPEGEAMRDYLIDHGVEPRHVVAETKSRNTEENLRFSRTLLSDPAAPVVVVTSSFHVFRAAMLTRRLGMKAHVVGSKTRWYFIPSALLREFAGVLRDHRWMHLLAIGLLVALTVLFSIIMVPAMVPPTPS